MREFATDIEQMEDGEAILEYAYAACREEGAIWFSYHFTPVFDSPTSKSTFVWARGYPDQIQKKYLGEGYREIDPVPQLTLAHGPILTWRQAMELGRGDSRSQRYFSVLRELKVENWVSFALFGPRNRNGFAALVFGNDPEEFETGKLTYLHTLLQTAHLGICKITDGSSPEVSLSNRECEVLIWMGHGKSAGEIATILEISPETVKTYIKRLYEKLDANDRVTATVRALKLGLVEL